MPHSLPSSPFPVPFPFPDEEVDLVVIGGGITGAGIALDAALRGMNTVLFERRDFGSGTSSRSSKLIHGGLRYLQQGNLHLVYEAVRERTRLRRLARHLVRPLPFLLPVYEGRGLPRTLLSLGLWLYEGLTGFRVEQIHCYLDPTQVREFLPHLQPSGLKGGFLYYDAATQDARLVYELIVAAREAGARCYSYTEVLGFSHRQGFWEVRYRLRNGEERTLKARAVILAVGAFGYREFPRLLPELKERIRPSKGVHLVLNPRRFRPHLPVAAVMQHPLDHRVTFLLPGRGFLYLGTTDTEEEESLDEPGVTREDVQYLLKVYHRYFPSLPVEEGDITATWAGVRPLLDEPGKGSTYKVSREHRLSMPLPGVFVIEGGKLTTYRAMAEECVDQCARYLARTLHRSFPRSLTAREPLPGSRGIEREEELETLKESLQRFGLSPELALHLTYTYGVRCLALLPYLQREPEPLLPPLPYARGEIRYILEHEDVFEFEDLLLRRTEIYYQDPENGLSVLPVLGEMLATIRGYSREEVALLEERYRERVQRGLQFRGSGSLPPQGMLPQREGVGKG